MPLVVVPGIIPTLVAGATKVGVVRVVVGGVVTYLLGTEVIARFIPGTDASIEDLEQDIKDLGLDIIEEGSEFVFTGFLNTVEYVGPAVIKGLERTYEAVRNSLRGNEVNTITAGTIVILTIITAIFLRSAVQVAGATVFNDSI